MIFHSKFVCIRLIQANSLQFNKALYISINQCAKSNIYIYIERVDRYGILCSISELNRHEIERMICPLVAKNHITGLFVECCENLTLFLRFFSFYFEIGDFQMIQSRI